MRWCRLYIETPSDPKLRRIAHTAGATVAHTLAVWTSMLCHAAGNEGDAWGTLTGWDDMDCAINLGIDRAIVFAIRQEMEGRTIEGTRILAWERRQHISDNGALRMRRWRERQAQANQEVSDEVTSPMRHGDATVTAKKRREEKREEKKEPPHSPPRKRGERVVSVSLPEWLPQEAWADWVAHRLSKDRKGWTQGAAEKSIATLYALVCAGEDPVAVIDLAIQRGWTGLFSTTKRTAA